MGSNTTAAVVNIAGMLLPVVFELLRQANMTPIQTAEWIEDRRRLFYASDPDQNPSVLPQP